MTSDAPVAWITGASKGIGRSLAIELAQRGYTVAASARDVEMLNALEQSVSQSSTRGRISVFPLDVTDPEATQQIHHSIEESLGPIDVAILNAGTHRETPAESFTSNDIQTLLQLNVMGTVHCLEHLLPSMRKRGRGRIAVVASLAGYRGLPTASGYGASKAALINLCESLNIELHGSGVDVQLINPGFVKTPLTDQNPFPMPFLISAQKAAVEIADGIESTRFEIRFPTAFALIMGALRYLPFTIYRYLIRKKTRG